MKKLLLGAILLFSIMSCSPDAVNEYESVPEAIVVPKPPVPVNPPTTPPITTPPVVAPPVVVDPIVVPPVVTPPVVVPAPITLPFNVYTKHGLKITGVLSFVNGMGENVFGITTKSDILDYQVYIHYDKATGKIHIYKWANGQENIKSFKVAGITHSFNGETYVSEFNCGTVGDHLNGFKHKMIRVGSDKKAGGKRWVTIADSSNPNGSIRLYTSYSTVDFDINIFEYGIKE